MLERIALRADDLIWEGKRLDRVHTHPSPAGSGTFRTFEVERDAPHDHEMVYVFPVAHEGWHALIRELFAFEERAWRAYWTVIERESEGARSTGAHVLPHMRLLGDIGQAVTCGDIFEEEHRLPAFRRPMVSWPKLEAADRLAPGLAKGLNARLQSVWEEAGEDLATLDLARVERLSPWRILSNGHDCLLTQFRFVHTAYADLTQYQEPR